MMRKSVLLLTLLLGLAFAAGEARAEDPMDILVIVNKAVGQTKISKDELKDIFLKKKSSWNAGGQAVPIHAPAGSELRNAFCARVLGMSTNEEQRYWQQFQVKTGNAQPASFSNTLKAVFKLKGSVSYVYRSQFKEGVAKVLLVLPAA